MPEDHFYELLGFLFLPLVIGSFIFMICNYAKLFYWEYLEKDRSAALFLFIFLYLTSLSIFFVWLSEDREFRRIYDLVESFGMSRWNIVGGILLIYLVSMIVFRIYCKEKDKNS